MMSDTANALVLAALKLREGKPLAAARLIAQAAHAPDFCLVAKKMLRAAEASDEVPDTEPKQVSVKEYAAEYLRPIFDEANNSLASDEDDEDFIDPALVTASDSDDKEAFETAEHAEKKAATEADQDAQVLYDREEEDDDTDEYADPDDEPDDESADYAVSGDEETADTSDIESINARLYASLVEINAAARKRKKTKAKKKQSKAASSGKKIKLTPREV